MDVREVAESLGIEPGAVRAAVARGTLAAIRKGGGAKRAALLLFDPAEVERYRREHLGRRGRRARGVAPPANAGKCTGVGDPVIGAETPVRRPRLFRGTDGTVFHLTNKDKVRLPYEDELAGWFAWDNVRWIEPTKEMLADANWVKRHKR